MDKKSSFLRMLWIPGTRKTHPKGHYGPTNKHISYTTKPKKSEVWSLGGSKLQKDLLKAESDTTLLDGATNSGLVSVACVATSVGAVAAATANGISNANKHSNANTASTAAAAAAAKSCSGRITPNESINSKTSSSNTSTPPNTPNTSTASTAPLISPTLNPLDEALNCTDAINGTCEATELMKMPAKSHSLTPVIVTATTTAEIMDVNHYSLLNNNKESLNSERFDVYSLPSPPKTFLNGNSNGVKGLENGTSIDEISSSNSTKQILEEQKRKLYWEKAIAIHKKIQNQHNNYHHNYSINNHSPRIHNNNQGDVNSIESINDDDDTTTISTKLYSSSTLPQHEKQQQQKFERQQQEPQQLKQDQQEQKQLQHQQQLQLQQQNVMSEHIILAKSKKKRKKKNGYTKDLDQLDGVAAKHSFNEDNKDDDEKVVKCLYYTLMCCDCTIS